MTAEPVVIFCTVGTTALYAELLLQSDRDTLPDLMREHRGLGDDAADLQDFERLHRLRARVLAAHHAGWSVLKTRKIPLSGDNLKRTSAEMTSLYGLCRSTGVGLGRLLRPGEDRLVFLAAANHNGKWAAEVNKDLAEMYLFEGSGISTPDVQIEEVQGLEGTGPDFSDIVPALKALLEKHSVGCRDVRCNFTGGYKGVIPALTWVCSNDLPKVQMFYQHEQMAEICRIDLRRGEQPTTSREPLTR